MVAWFLYNHVLHFMTHPVPQLRGPPPQPRTSSRGNLVTTGPLEGFTTRLKVSRLRRHRSGVARCVLWELWRFITPGLHKNEKRYVVPFVPRRVVLFALGVTTAILVFPKALDWLIWCQRQRRRPAVLPVERTSPSTWPCA